jgi:alpha-beta hydrolase superfamily lysophospholipase
MTSRCQRMLPVALARLRFSSPWFAMLFAIFAVSDVAAATMEQARAQCREQLTPVVRECVRKKTADSGGSPFQYISGCRAAVMPQARTCVAKLIGAAGARPATDADRPAAGDGATADSEADIAVSPPSGPGRVVLVISGNEGPSAYKVYAEKIAMLGYYTVIIDGKDLLSGDMQGSGRLQKAIEKAQSSPDALPGKIAVIGFSQGGGGALAYAERQPDTVSTVIGYYPLTAFIAKVTDMKHFVGKFQVPLLVFAGGKDTYRNCCLLTTMRSMEAAAKQLGKPMEVVVYPNADHNFIKGPNYRADDTDDAWRRTTDALHQYLDDAPAR